MDIINDFKSTYTCPHSNMFGEPGTGAHAHRILGLASVDVFATMIIAIIIVYLKYEKTAKNFIGVFIVLVMIATFLHWLFCVPTAGLTMLGLA